MNDEIRYLGDVQRLALREGDVVVLTAKCRLTGVEKDHISESMKNIFKNNLFVILDSNFEISVVGGETCIFCKQPVQFSLDGEPVTGLSTGIGRDNIELVHVSCLNAERDKHRKSLEGQNE